MEEEFYKKYSKKIFLKNGAGIEDIKKYPDTKTHRQLNPELYNFNFFGFECNIKRHSKVHTWIGYVKLYENHPYFNEDNGNNDYIDNYEKNRTINNVSVHGGVTYSQICIIGFDTHHYNDGEPLKYLDVNKPYRDYDYVVKELKCLALQLYLMLPKWSKQTHFQFPLHLQERFLRLYNLFYDIRNKIQEKNIWLQIISESFEKEKYSLFSKYKDFLLY